MEIDIEGDEDEHEEEKQKEELKEKVDKEEELFTISSKKINEAGRQLSEADIVTDQIDSLLSMYFFFFFEKKKSFFD